MSEIFRGPAEDVEHFVGLLGHLHELGIGVAGSVGRLATFADAGIEVPPLNVTWWNPEDPARTYYRDIDIVSGAKDDAIARKIDMLHAKTKHCIDWFLARYFDVAGSNLRYYARGEWHNVPVDPETLRFHERNMGGIPVLTFSGGTMEAIMSPWIPNKDPFKAEKHARIARQMAPLFAKLREERPNEFLPPEAYEPFKEVTEKEEFKIGLPFWP